MFRPTNLKKAWALLLSVVISLPALAANSVSRGDVTWYFSTNAETGVYANGDPWVIGPVVVQKITPGARYNGSASINGSMINPDIDRKHGLDSRLRFNEYEDSLNVGKRLPLTLKAGDTLLTAISNFAPAAGDDPQLEQLQILTVVSSKPQAGAFRPPYIGRRGNTNWNKNNLDFSVLRSLPKPSANASFPDLQNLERQFDYPWIVKSDSWTNRYFRASSNHPWRDGSRAGNYGREIAHMVSDAVLSLQLDYSIQDKEKLLISLVQAGIDIYGAAKYGGADFHADGGHNIGNKLPLLLAGAVLNDTALLDYANKEKAFIFQEDQQTFYVDKNAVILTQGRSWNPDSRDVSSSVVSTYSTSDIGLAEWGIRHKNEPERDNKHWDAQYRHVASPAMIGHALAAQLMGLEDEWNWKPFFDYADRYYGKQKAYSSDAVNAIQSFVKAMWESYRFNRPDNGTEGTTDSPPLPPANITISQDPT